MEKDLNIESKIKKVKSQAVLFAKSVVDALAVPQSQIFLETIYTPFLSLIMQGNEWSPLCNPNRIIFKNFDELFAHINHGSELYIPGKNIFSKDLDFNNGDYDLTLDRSLNIYEKIVFKLFRISYLEMKHTKIEVSSELKPNFEARNKLKKLIGNYNSDLINNDIVDFLPMSLFEDLKSEIKQSIYPSARVHWLGNIYIEKYLFYLAYLKEKGTRIIGEPHGGMFCQLKSPPDNEIAELIVSDVYLKPSWDVTFKAHPSTRISRNLFINIKNFKFIKKKKRKMLVLLPYFFREKEPTFTKAFYGEIKSNEFHENRIKELKNHFQDNIDFKSHPVQNDVEISEIKFIKKLYPSAQLISKGLSQNISHEYSGVIYLNATGTSILELSTTRISQYVYLGPEQRLNNDYASFLWNTKKSSTRENHFNGAWIEVDNNKYRSAYGASYFYPFYFVNLIWKQINTH
jgi:hypothetical protein